jgi:hypothetical protein
MKWRPFASLKIKDLVFLNDIISNSENEILRHSDGDYIPVILPQDDNRITKPPYPKRGAGG